MLAPHLQLTPYHAKGKNELIRWCNHISMATNKQLEQVSCHTHTQLWREHTTMNTGWGRRGITEHLNKLAEISKDLLHISYHQEAIELQLLQECLVHLHKQCDEGNGGAVCVGRRE